MTVIIKGLHTHLVYAYKDFMLLLNIRDPEQ